MAKKILVIDGSPRVGKNTDQLCDAFMKGAQEAGHEVVKFRVAGKKINGCIHCMQCFKN
ncbi:MAG: flavodoxin family protein, partial [Clostridia bacterium]|nr:flavodoxin family protein [Clostridia bacterium]